MKVTAIPQVGGMMAFRIVGDVPFVPPLIEFSGSKYCLDYETRTPGVWLAVNVDDEYMPHLPIVKAE